MFAILFYVELIQFLESIDPFRDFRIVEVQCVGMSQCYLDGNCLSFKDFAIRIGFARDVLRCPSKVDGFYFELG